MLSESVAIGEEWCRVSVGSSPLSTIEAAVLVEESILSPNAAMTTERKDVRFEK